jgi:hypothetical protein
MLMTKTLLKLVGVLKRSEIAKSLFFSFLSYRSLYSTFLYLNWQKYVMEYGS